MPTDRDGFGTPRPETASAPVDGVGADDVVDLHVNVLGVGFGCTGNFMAPGTLRSLPVRRALSEAGLPRIGAEPDLDGLYWDRLRTAILNAPSVGRVVVLGLDDVFNPDGSRNEVRAQITTANEHVARLAAELPERVSFGASIHPYRRGAADHVAEWLERGAVLLRWMPSTQGIDPADARCRPIYRELARRRAPLLAHTGSPHLTRSYDESVASPLALRPALDAGVTVIAAHSGTRSSPLFARRHVDRLETLCERYDNLYGDTAGFCSAFRGRALRRRLGDSVLGSRLVHGSGYPLPSHATWFPARLGLAAVQRLESILSPLERDVWIKRALGIPEPVFRRGARLLEESESAK